MLHKMAETEGKEDDEKHKRKDRSYSVSIDLSVYGYIKRGNGSLGLSGMR